MAGFSDELCKIAQVNMPDPAVMELEQYRKGEHPAKRPMNKEVFKQFLADTGVIAGGAGAGYGLGRLTVDALKKQRIPGWAKMVVPAAGVTAGLGGALALRGMMRDMQQKRLEEAYQRGLEAKKRAA